MKNWLLLVISVLITCLHTDARAADIRSAARRGDMAAVRGELARILDRPELAP